MLGLADSNVVRYVGIFLATGAYVCNWPALYTYYSNNITGSVVILVNKSGTDLSSQWKRAVSAAVVSGSTGLGGVAGSYIIRQSEAPSYPTAIWVSIGWMTLELIRNKTID